MVDKRAEGAVGAPFILRVERGKIAEFARAIGAQHSDHGDPVAPVMPATFLTTMFHWERAVQDASPWPAVQMSKQRGMHASQRYIFHGPPPAADAVLHCQSRIERIFTKQGRRGGELTFVEMVTEFRDADGKLVAEAKMTAVETQGKGEKNHDSENSDA